MGFPKLLVAWVAISIALVGVWAEEEVEIGGAPDLSTKLELERLRAEISALGESRIRSLVGFFELGFRVSICGSASVLRTEGSCVLIPVQLLHYLGAISERFAFEIRAWFLRFCLRIIRCCSS